MNAPLDSVTRGNRGKQKRGPFCQVAVEFTEILCCYI